MFAFLWIFINVLGSDEPQMVDVHEAGVAWKKQLPRWSSELLE